MKHASLFSGIGGFDLAAEWMGWDNVFHCEWNPFGRKVLNHYWPNAISYEDITKTDFSIHRGTIDILTGGFPCQPYSQAGKRKGKDDERHLWPEMLRAIREIEPTWVVGENVLGLVNWNGGLVFEEVQADLEAQGYEVQPYVLPAASVGAPHRRDRVWFVAYSNRNGHESRGLGESGCAESKSVSLGNKRQRVRSDNRRISESGDVTDTDSLTRRFEERELPDQQKQRRHVSEIQGFVSEQYAPHTQGPNEQWDRLREICRQRSVRRCRCKGNATDTSISGLEVSGQTRIRKYEEEAGEGVDNRFKQCCADVTNSNGIGLRGQSNGPGESRLFNQKSEGNYWQNFPTQPPVCSGDDGFSSRLDGITFSKWRNESIKAGGNAIVPQVVYQIFKAIEMYELQ